MIWIISLVLTIFFILSGVFIGFAPPAHSLVEKDFLNRAGYYARLEGLQYGNICLRAKTMDPAVSNVNSPQRRRVIQSELFTAAVQTTETLQRTVYSDIQVLPGAPATVKATADLVQPKTPPAPQPQSLLSAPTRPDN